MNTKKQKLDCESSAKDCDLKTGNGYISAEVNPTMEEEAVELFREYLRIRTVQPQPDYDAATEFLKRLAAELDLSFRKIQLSSGQHVVLMTWEGLDPSLPTILLNSHTDVVPVFPDQWNYEAFDAHMTENGDIYARGTQDMKCVTIQYLEAIRKLKKEGKSFLRTVHLSFVPDEEIGGSTGMGLFVNTDEFKALNVAFAFDEGLANPTDAYTVFYTERSPVWISVKASGNVGHGSRFIENTAAEKLNKVINSFLEFREQEKKRLESSSELKLGDVTTVNWTMVEGGVQINVVPSDMSAGFDIRVAPTVDLKEFIQKIETWCKEAGEGVTCKYIQKFIPSSSSITSTENSNPWWRIFKNTCDGLGMKLEPEVFPAATDSRFIRKIGIPAFGFSPMNNTPILLHDHNEFLNAKVFLKGIDVYTHLIPAMANASADEVKM